MRKYCSASSIVGVLSLLCATYGAVADPAAVPLTEANQVRALTPEQASHGYPVHIRGVVTDAVPSPDFFIQDKSAGIYVEGNTSRVYSPHVGDVIEIDGVTGPGRFAPVVREIQSHIVGESALPRTRLYDFSELAHGRFDSQWVQIRGIIRSASLDNVSWREATLAMTVSSGVGQFKARVPISQARDFSSWVGKEALITGVCGSLFNAERQFIGVLLYVPGLRFLEAVSPIREVPVPELLRFSPQPKLGGRVRVRGVVSYQEIGSVLFIQAGGNGLQVRSQQNTPFAVGDIVEAVGQPTVGESAPILEDAIVTRVGHQSPPVAVDFDPSVRWEHYDGALVRIDAKILNYERQAEEPALLLEHSGFIFSAALPPGPVRTHLLSIPLSSDLRVTGICLVRNGGLWRIPESFRLLLRSNHDVLILQRPSWWNVRHTAWLLGISLGTLLIVLAWSMLLRRRIREQMEALRQKLRSGAVLEERNRIARELHDTLEQDLAGITLHLDLATDCFERAPELSQQAVEIARRMSRRSMVEARRSVWDLRSHLLENHTLSAALAQAVEPLAVSSHVKIEVAVTGEAIRLDPVIEMNALRIGQEAITNAIKHARATAIRVELHFRPKSLTLLVRDDGCGFDHYTATVAAGSHFGLLDMKERANGLGSRLEICSTPGRGTSVEVEIPLGHLKVAHGESKADSYSRG